jgi:hypothetical protein
MPKVRGTLIAIERANGVGILVGLIGIVILFHDLAGKPVAATLWGDDTDPNLIVWTLEWVYHTIFIWLTPLDVWNANSYFPHLKSLAYSDSLLSAQFLYAPLRLLGVSPLPALYLTLASICLAGVLLTDCLLRDYHFTVGERALVISAAHFSLPITVFLIAHFQLFGMQLAPPFLLALHRLLNSWRGRDLVLVTLLFCLAGGFATYFVPMAGLVAALVCLLFSMRLARHGNIAALVRGPGWKSIAFSLAILLVFFVVLMLPYLVLFASLPPQPLSDTFQYSARPWSILLDASPRSLWYKPRPITTEERVAFPGFSLLLLGAAGGLAFLRSAPGVSLDREKKPIVPLAAYAVAIFAICWVLSWGPYLQLGARGGFRLDLPYLAFAHFIPGVGNVRAPGRFAQFFGLPLGLMAVLSVRWFTTRWRLATTVGAMLLTAIILIDQLPKIATYPFSIDHGDFFRAAKSLIKRGEPIVQLPITGVDHAATWMIRLRQLVSSTILWNRLIDGAGSRETPELDELISLDWRLHRGEASLSELADFARKLSITKLVFFLDDYPSHVQEKIETEISAIGARVLMRNTEGLILQLPPHHH